MGQHPPASAEPGDPGPSTSVSHGHGPVGRWWQLPWLFPTLPFWWESRRSMLFDVLVALGYTAAVVLFTVPRDHPFGVPEPAFYAVAVLMGLALIGRRRRPASLCAAAVLATPVLLQVSPLPFFLYALAAYGRRRHLAMLTAAAVLTLAAIFFLPARTGLLPSYALIFFVAGPVLLGLYAGARRAVVENLRERAERLEREQSLLRRQARTEERTRIAREMHDVVAHRVSLMVIHSGALEVGAADGERAAEAGRLIGDIGRQALDELREVLSVLRLDEDEEAAPRAPQPTVDDLATLVEQSRSTGMRIELVCSGPRRPLAQATGHTVYRLVQEALTNVHKHAGNAATRIELRYGPDALRVAVDNEMPAGPVTVGLPSGGNGLVGLRERITLQGGVFEAGPRPEGGFRVAAELPMKEEAP